jgi:hypothetical protein
VAGDPRISEAVAPIVEHMKEELRGRQATCRPRTARWRCSSRAVGNPKGRVWPARPWGGAQPPTPGDFHRTERRWPGSRTPTCIGNRPHRARPKGNPYGLCVPGPRRRMGGSLHCGPVSRPTDSMSHAGSRPSSALEAGSTPVDPPGWPFPGGLARLKAPVPPFRPSRGPAGPCIREQNPWVGAPEGCAS